MNRTKLIQRLTIEEGLRLLPYKDSRGILTLGIGHNLSVPITRTAAEAICNDDITAHAAQLTSSIPWIGTLDDARQDVLIDMCFNLGVGGLLEFRATLAAVQGGDYPTAAAQMLQSSWATEVGHRAQVLAQIMKDGVE